MKRTGRSFFTIGCVQCDEVVSVPLSRIEGRYKCPVCGHTLLRRKYGATEKMFALSVAALVLFGVTVYFPFLSFEVAGNASHINFITGIRYLFENHDWLLGVAVLMTTVVVPLQRIVLFLTLYGPLYFGKVPWYAVSSLKVLHHSTPWGMLDVFLVGVLVSLVKLLKMGAVHTGTSVWAFGALVFVMAALEVHFHPQEIWERIEAKERTNASR